VGLSATAEQLAITRIGQCHHAEFSALLTNTVTSGADKSFPAFESVLSVSSAREVGVTSSASGWTA